MSRNRRKQIWADEAFVYRLEQIRAKRTLAGMPIKNMTELTRLFSESKAFNQIEEELLDYDNKNHIKFDRWI
jgi:hypothetical protein